MIPLSHRISDVQEYYFSKKLREVRAMVDRGIPVINIGIGSPDIVPPDEVIETLVRGAKHPAAHGYQSYKGIPVLREAMARYYRDHLDCTPDPASEILPLMGSKEGIMHIAMAFLNPGDNVLVPDPGYPSYSAASKMAGAEVRTYDLTEENGWQPDIKALAVKLDSNTKIIWLNYPHMPTGARMDSKVMEQLISLALQKNILLVNDNPYGFILNKDRKSILSIPGAKACSIELNSLSKSHAMPGWRIGMLVGQAEYIDAVLRFKSNMDSGMFRPSQEAAAVALGLGDKWFEANDTIYRKRREILYPMLDAIGFEYRSDTAGLFIWSKVSDRFGDGEEASDFFLHKCGVFVPPGVVFGQNGSQYVRWSICSDAEVLKLAVERIMHKMVPFHTTKTKHQHKTIDG